MVVLYLDELKKYLPKLKSTKYVPVDTEDVRIRKARESQQEYSQQVLREAVAEKRRKLLEEKEAQRAQQQKKQPVFVPFKKDLPQKEELKNKETKQVKELPSENKSNNNNQQYFNFGRSDLPRYRPTGFQKKGGS